jgi:hypothetical protein
MCCTPCSAGFSDNTGRGGLNRAARQQNRTRERRVKGSGGRRQKAEERKPSKPSRPLRLRGGDLLWMMDELVAAAAAAAAAYTAHTHTVHPYKHWAQQLDDGQMVLSAHMVAKHIHSPDSRCTIYRSVFTQDQITGVNSTSY